MDPAEDERLPAHFSLKEARPSFLVAEIYENAVESIQPPTC